MLMGSSKQIWRQTIRIWLKTANLKWIDNRPQKNCCILWIQHRQKAISCYAPTYCLRHQIYFHSIRINDRNVSPSDCHISEPQFSVSHCRRKIVRRPSMQSLRHFNRRTYLVLSKKHHHHRSSSRWLCWCHARSSCHSLYQFRCRCHSNHFWKRPKLNWKRKNRKHIQSTHRSRPTQYWPTQTSFVHWIRITILTIFEAALSLNSH